MMKKTFITAVLILTATCLFSGTVMAKQGADSKEPLRVQEEEYQPYDEWYGPDETVETDQGNQQDRVDVPEEPPNNAREAPEQDTRSRER